MGACSAFRPYEWECVAVESAGRRAMLRWLLEGQPAIAPKQQDRIQGAQATDPLRNAKLRVRRYRLTAMLGTRHFGHP